jgi:hypothetical protein
MPADWKEDGLVSEREGLEGAVVQGGRVNVRILMLEARRHQRFAVYRRATQTEADTDPDAVYLVRIGLLEVERKISEGLYRARVLKSSDAVEAGDLLKLER